MRTWAQAIERLVEERGRALFGYAYVLTGDPDRAEDLVQEALVRAFARNRGTMPIDAAHAYVKRAIGTAFIDSGRRAAARPRTADGVEPSGSQPDHADAVAARTSVQAALLTLPARERACVVLRYLEDLPVAGVARELGLAEGSVKRYLSDALGRLRAMGLDVAADAAEAANGGSSAVPVTTVKGRRP